MYKSNHHKNLDNLLEQFKINCHRTLDEYLEEPHPQMSKRVRNSNNSWLAKFIIAYEGEQWSKSNVDEFDLDYARLTGWLRGLARRHIK